MVIWINFFVDMHVYKDIYSEYGVIGFCVKRLTFEICNGGFL